MKHLLSIFIRVVALKPFNLRLDNPVALTVALCFLGTLFSKELAWKMHASKHSVPKGGGRRVVRSSTQHLQLVEVE